MAKGAKVGDAYINIAARLDDLEKEFGKLDRSVKKQTSTMEKNLGGAFKRLGGLAAGAFALDKITSFVIKATELAGVFEGVEAAFNRLNNPALLDGLRKATQGTISDLELMKAAVRANNFKVPLNQLAGFFEFATKRAAQTGESVDYLVNSIIDGIGRKSTLVLDNLGISASELQEEIKKTGDFGQAAGNIIQRELAAAGDVALTSAQKTQQLNAQLENVTVEVGQKLIPVMNELKEAAIGSLSLLNQLIDDDVDLWSKLQFVLASATGNTVAMGNAISEMNVQQIVANQTQQESVEVMEEVAVASEKVADKVNKVKIGYEDLFNVLAPTAKVVDELSTKFAEVAEVMEEGEPWFQTAEQVKNLAETSALLSDIIGQGLTQSFQAALINGESFTFTLEQYFVRLAERILVAVAAAAALAAILSATGLGGGLGFLGNFKSLFGNFAGFDIPGFARGGQVPGGMTLVGERGPELVNLPRNANVTPNHEMGRFGSGMFNGTIPISGDIKGNDIFLSNQRSGVTRKRVTG